MSLAAIERRKAPRFGVECTGELASGTCLFTVKIIDMSVSGCGVEILEPPDSEEDAFGPIGILGIAGASQSKVVLLPVAVNEERFTGGKRRLGLQFRRLSPPQMRNLIAVMDALIPDPCNGLGR